MILSLLASLTPAHACGGFFCNNDPVDQSGEDIVFAVDEAKGEVTVHVQIAYAGSAEAFAWIVPVPQVPELVLSSDRIFQELAWRTQPRFGLEYEEIFDCEDDRYWDYAWSSSSAPSAAGGTLDTGVAPPSVEVIAEQRVGPYETVTLRADTSEVLLEWLQTNGYQLPDDLDPVLAPYVASESFFVALKLAKDSDVGQLSPLAMRYPGTSASVPIQLTSIAATPDMRLRVYVLGAERAVPESYLHVKINDLVVDWFRGGANYEDAITVAADEAGGHAFATDFSGPSELMKDALWSEGRYDLAALAAAPDPYAFFDLLLSQGFVGDATMLALFREFLPMPAALAADGVDEASFYNCLRCYSEQVDAIPFDAAAFAAAIDERVVTPLRMAQGMFDTLPHLTRLTSSVSPVEMTVDPTFVFNGDMEQEVGLQRTAKVQMLCGWGGKWSEAPRKLVLPDGRSYDLPSELWFQDRGLTEYEYLSELMTTYAMVIERTGASGDPEVLFDGSEQAVADAEAFNGDGEATGAGCGCSGTGGAASALGWLGALALIGRRRRA